MTSRGSSPSRSVCCSKLLSSSDATPSSTEKARSSAAWHTGFGSLQGAAADEDGEPAEEALLLIRQQVVAPLDGVAQCLLAGGQIAWAPGEEVQAMRETLEQGLWGQQLAARRRQFDGQRQSVQTHADLSDDAGIGRR